MSKFNEFIDGVNRAIPYAKYVIDISAPQKYMGVEVLSRMEHIVFHSRHYHLGNERAQRRSDRDP